MTASERYNDDGAGVTCNSFVSVLQDKTGADSTLLESTYSLLKSNFTSMPSYLVSIGKTISNNLMSQQILVQTFILFLALGMGSQFSCNRDRELCNPLLLLSSSNLTITLVSSNCCIQLSLSSFQRDEF